MKKANVEVKVSESKISKIVGDESKSKSQKMKDLFELGLEIREIATLMNVRYNFVYNVVSNHARINDIETTSVERNSRKNEILEMFKQGKTNVEISKELKVNYNYVFKVIKEAKLENEAKVKSAE